VEAAAQDPTSSRANQGTLGTVEPPCCNGMLGGGGGHARVPALMYALVSGALASGAFFFLIHRSHSISFTRAQGIPKYKVGFGRGERMVELGKDWLIGEGGGVIIFTQR
jgi:hypothetical protein